MAIIASGNSATALDRANVLLILTEDQGPHLGYAGTAGIRTPNMDSLAASGVYFENAFVAYPVCSASKAAMLTGRCSHENGLLNNTQNYHKSGSQLTPAEKKNPVYLKLRVREEIPTLIERLHQAGYYQGVTHKLHVAPVEKFPYDEFIAAPRGKSATDFINRAEEAGKPWFLLYNISDSHRKYPDSDKTPIRVKPSEVKIPKFLPDTPVVRKDWAEYLAAIEKTDVYVGQALAALKASGQEERTIVIFMGDHGPSFNRGKMNLNDFGLRVPLVVRVPGMARGVRSKALVSELDITPTVLDLIGVPPLARTQGLSLRPALSGGAEVKIHEYVYAEISHAPLAPDGGMQERSIYDGRFHPIVREGLGKPRQVNEDEKFWQTWGNRTYDETVRGKDRFPDAYRFLTWMDPQPLDGHPPRFEFYHTSADPDEMAELGANSPQREDFLRLYKKLREWSKITQDAAMKYNEPP